MNANFNAYSSKILKDVVPLSKAKFVLNRLLLFHNTSNSVEQAKVVLDHSFVKGSSRHLDYMNSKQFRQFIDT